MVRASARSMVAMPWTAMFRRSCGSWLISWKKPWPSPSPSRLLVGTRTSLKNSSEVSAASMPSLSRLRPRSKPGALSVSTRISEVPRAPWVGSVLQTTMIRLAVWPLVMKVLEPLMTYSLPSSRAVVLMPCRSLPAPGSVMAIALTYSQVASFGSQRRFWSSVP